MKVVKGKIIKSKITDRRGVWYDVSSISGATTLPMISPITWKLCNKWPDGFYIQDSSTWNNSKQILLRVENMEVIEAYKLVSLIKGIDII